MSVPDESYVTVYKTASQLPSSWPAGINHSPAFSRYVYSIKPEWNINPLDHVHVIDIDEPQDPDPLEMKLTLPILQNLPLSSRIYFFYVTQANAGDLITFQPVLLSGNTVNQNAISYTFVATGNRELIIAIGVNNNYILHTFGQNNAPPPPPPPFSGGNPAVLFNYTSQASVQTNSIIYPISYAGSFGTPTGLTRSHVPSGTASGPEIVIKSGMEGFFTPNVSIPTTVVTGFRCNQAGWYRITAQYQAIMNFNTSTNPQGSTFAFGMGVFSSIGNYQVENSKFCPIQGALTATLTATPNQVRSVANPTFWMLLTANQFIVPAFIYDGTNIVFTSGQIQGDIVFEYIVPDASPAPLMMSMASDGGVGGDGDVGMASFFEEELQRGVVVVDPRQEKIKEVNAKNTDPELFSVSTKRTQAQVLEIQKKYIKDQQISSKKSAASSSSFSGGAPGFTLQDMEKMIHQALNARQYQQQQQYQPPQLAQASTSLSAAPASKRRKRSTSSSTSAGKEPETLLKEFHAMEEEVFGAGASSSSSSSSSST